jgi:hypothetical protein
MLPAMADSPIEHDGFSLAATSHLAAQPVRLRCPFCRHLGTFEPIANVNDAKTMGSKDGVSLGCGMGVRRCPNSECLKGMFVVASGETAVAAYPPEVLDVDTTNLPPQVLGSLEEAVRCHSVGSYRAAAIMVRRTLEDVCADRGATGANLKERIKALGSTVVIPPDLLDGLDELRLLGNDAAHVNAQEYADVGQQEVELAIDVVKAMLLGIYQTADLVARLRAQKFKPPTT